jgi:hypothetical protein
VIGASRTRFSPCTRWAWRPSAHPGCMATNWYRGSDDSVTTKPRNPPIPGTGPSPGRRPRRPADPEPEFGENSTAHAAPLRIVSYPPARSTSPVSNCCAGTVGRRHTRRAVVASPTAVLRRPLVNAASLTGAQLSRTTIARQRGAADAQEICRKFIRAFRPSAKTASIDRVFPVRSGRPYPPYSPCSNISEAADNFGENRRSRSGRRLKIENPFTTMLEDRPWTKIA